MIIEVEWPVDYPGFVGRAEDLRQPRLRTQRIHASLLSRDGSRHIRFPPAPARGWDSACGKMPLVPAQKKLQRQFRGRVPASVTFLDRNPLATRLLENPCQLASLWPEKDCPVNRPP
jgi:hypothetical protein